MPSLLLFESQELWIFNNDPVNVLFIIPDSYWSYSGERAIKREVRAGVLSLSAEACFNHQSEPAPNILNMMA